MKYLLLFIVVAISTVGHGQTVQSPSTAKSAVISTDLFYDEKIGIIRLVMALKPLNAEFKATDDELKLLVEKHRTLAAELIRITNPERIEYSDRVIKEKIDEAESLRCKIQSVAEEAKTRYSKKRDEVARDIFRDIGRSIDDFAKEQSINIIIVNDSTEPIFEGLSDVTLDFIEFYNSRPTKVSNKQK